MLFEGRCHGMADIESYDVSLNGQRFLLIQASEPEQAATQIHVALNWLEDLKRRAAKYLLASALGSETRWP